MKIEGYYWDFEAAIENGEDFYCDAALFVDGRSGGMRCPICKKWGQLPRKRKHLLAVWINECELCEIKDPLIRSLCKLNRIITDEERDEFNKFRAIIYNFADKLFIDENQRSLIKQISRIPILKGKDDDR